MDVISLCEYRLKVSVETLAGELRMPPELLLLQLKAAGVIKELNSTLFRRDKERLLRHLQSESSGVGYKN